MFIGRVTREEGHVTYGVLEAAVFKPLITYLGVVPLIFLLLASTYLLLNQSEQQSAQESSTPRTCVEPANLSHAADVDTHAHAACFTQA